MSNLVKLHLGNEAKLQTTRLALDRQRLCKNLTFVIPNPPCPPYQGGIE